MSRFACTSLALAALTWAGLSAPAAASVVARERVSLGRLSDASDLIAVAEVLQGNPPRLRVEATLKGSASGALDLPASRYVTLRAGQRGIFFLRRETGGGWRGLVTDYQRLLLHDPAHEDELKAAIRTRLPQLGGDATALPRALYGQLSAGLARVRQDAAWDLLGLAQHQPDPTQRAALAAALQGPPSVPLLRLCRRFPSAAMLSPVLDIARRHGGELREEAGRALQAIDPDAAIQALEVDLRAGSRLQGLHATGVAGAMEVPAATRLLRQALAHSLEAVRLDAIRNLARRSLSEREQTSLEAAVWGQSSRRVASAALAALALTAPGASLVRVATQHPDPELRRLAQALRREPLRAGRPFLR